MQPNIMKKILVPIDFSHYAKNAMYVRRNARLQLRQAISGKKYHIHRFATSLSVFTDARRGTRSSLMEDFSAGITKNPRVSPIAEQTIEIIKNNLIGKSFSTTTERT